MNLMEALSGVTQSDLDEITAKCEALETELSQLREVRKIIEVKLGVRKPVGHNLKGRPKRRSVEDTENTPATLTHSAMNSTGQAYTQTELHRIAARKYLQQHGCTSQSGLAKQCNIPAGSITAVLRHDWFMHTARGVELSRSGRAEG